MSTPPLRTYDIRVWTPADLPRPAVFAFFLAVRKLALDHDGIDVRWVDERFDREGGPRIRRVHPPPEDDEESA